MDPVEYIKEIFSNPITYSIIFVISTAIEISPIKINPWKGLFKWIGNAINAEILKEIELLKDDVSTIKKDQEEDAAETMRCRILDFSRSCRRHEEHDAEEWNNIISILRKYENHVKERGITNGVIEENAAYLRELYHDRLTHNDFEKKEETS